VPIFPANHNQQAHEDIRAALVLLAFAQKETAHLPSSDLKERAKQLVQRWTEIKNHMSEE